MATRWAEVISPVMINHSRKITFLITSCIYLWFERINILNSVIWARGCTTRARTYSRLVWSSKYVYVATDNTENSAEWLSPQHRHLLIVFFSKDIVGFSWLEREWFPVFKTDKAPKTDTPIVCTEKWKGWGESRTVMLRSVIWTYRPHLTSGTSSVQHCLIITI
jgi:hypothetical protein